MFLKQRSRKRDEQRNLGRLHSSGTVFLLIGIQTNQNISWKPRLWIVLNNFFFPPFSKVTFFTTSRFGLFTSCVGKMELFGGCIIEQNNPVRGSIIEQHLHRIESHVRV